MFTFYCLCFEVVEYPVDFEYPASFITPCLVMICLYLPAASILVFGPQHVLEIPRAELPQYLLVLNCCEGSRDCIGGWFSLVQNIG